MKKYISLFLILTLLTAFCACGETVEEPTEPMQSQTQQLTDGDAATQFAPSTSEAAEQTAAPTTAAVQPPTELPEIDIPAIEEYTLVAEETRTKSGFVFEGKKESTLTCNKIVMINKDGTTEFSISFAEDGSGLSIYTLEPDGTRYKTIAEFDRQGNLVGIFNGSGSYSSYTYADKTCVLKAYDAENTLIDMRTYYYNDKDLTERVERGDEEGVYEHYYYTYDENDRNTSLRVENDTGYILYESAYNEDGDLLSTRIEQNNEFYGLQVYTYDENGKKESYTFRNDEKAPHWADVTVYYHNVFDQDGTYLGTSEVDSQTQEVYISVAYDYVQTEYLHYAEFIKAHYMKY